LRILHVVPSYLPAVRYGGPVLAVHGLARALVARGHGVEVFTTNLDGPTRLAVPTDAPQTLDGVRIRYFEAASPRRLHRAPRMAAALRGEIGGFEMVHLHSLFLWPTLVAARAARGAGVPYVLSPRGMLVRDLVRRRGRWRKALWLRLFERATIAGARALVATSALEAREAEAFGIPLAPIRVVPNGVDVAELEGPATDPGVPRPFLLFLGRLSWKKGVEHLVSALPQLPGVALALAGPDDEGLGATLGRQAASLGVGERVHRVGAVSGAAKRGLLRAAEALVLPSLSENFGNVVLEAMASGCPALVSPEVGLGADLAASGAGAIVPTARLADALRELLADRPRRARMAAAGPAYVRRHFDWARVAALMEAVYREASC